MLDVHVPHSTHTWKDFFIHIATISVGLLIAIGLEQTVEYFHHRQQAAETREAIRQELQEDQAQFSQRGDIFRKETQRLQTNLRVFLYLRAHPNAPVSEWPGEINWHNFNNHFPDAAWQTASQSGLLNLLPPREVQHYKNIHTQLDIIDHSLSERLDSIRKARSFMTNDADPSHLIEAELQKEIEQAEDVLSWQYRTGSDMRNLGMIDHDFKNAPTTPELNDLMHEPHGEEYLQPISSPSKQSQDESHSK